MFLPRLNGRVGIIEVEAGTSTSKLMCLSCCPRLLGSVRRFGQALPAGPAPLSDCDSIDPLRRLCFLWIAKKNGGRTIATAVNRRVTMLLLNNDYVFVTVGDKD